MADLPVLLHIPHASTVIPDQEMGDYLLSKDQLSVENLKLADLYTDELYQLDGADRVVFPVSRFLVDVERFSDDALESMAARGMGALYTVTTDLHPMRVIVSPERRAELMERYYWPHHRSLDAITFEILKSHKKCLFVDCHSYPSKSLPYEMATRTLHRPQIGIGTDEFHTPSDLVAAVFQEFERLGYEVGLNEPFAGTLVPSSFYRKERRVAAFMIEVRKDLYMDEATGLKLPSFEKVQSDLRKVMGYAAAII